MATYKQVDETLFGGMLPGGTRPGGKKILTPEEECKANGGTWFNNKCIMPDAPKPKEPPKKEEVRQPNQTSETFTSSETGRASGITLPDGRTFLGLSPEDVATVAEGERQRLARPEGIAPVGTQRKIEEEQARIQQISSQIGQLTPEQRQRIQSATEAPIDWGQAATAGIMNVGPSAISGMLGGAAIGAISGGGPSSALTAPAGAIIGATAGIFTGFLNGVKSNIKDQQRGEIGASRDALTNARTNMMKLSRIVSTDPSKAAEAVDLYNEQLALVYLAQSKTKLEVQGNLNKFMEDGTDILSDYDLFLSPGGQADIYGMRLMADLNRNVPLTSEELASWELEQ